MFSWIISLPGILCWPLKAFGIHNHARASENTAFMRKTVAHRLGEQVLRKIIWSRECVTYATNLVKQDEEVHEDSSSHTSTLQLGSFLSFFFHFSEFFRDEKRKVHRSWCSGGLYYSCIIHYWDSSLLSISHYYTISAVADVFWKNFFPLCFFIFLLQREYRISFFCTGEIHRNRRMWLKSAKKRLARCETLLFNK